MVLDPIPTRREPVTDLLHGESVTDPYRWLEAGTSEETAAWVEAQNARTRATLDALPGRAAIGRRLTELLSIGWTHAPVPRGAQLFYQRRDGDQNQPILYTRTGEAGAERVLIDPNTLATDGTIALDWWHVSPDGAHIAYGISGGGDEWSTLQVLDVHEGGTLPLRIERARAADVAWLPDGSGFYYTRYPQPDPEHPGAEHYNRHVYRHRFGDDPVADENVFGEGRDPADWSGVDLSPDGRWLVVSVQQGWSRTELYLRDEWAAEAPFVPLIAGEDAVSSVIFTREGMLLHTNLDAPHYRLVQVDPAQPQHAAWWEIVAERPDAVLESVVPAGGRLLLAYLKDAISEVTVCSLDGGDRRTLTLPGIGRVEGITGERDLGNAYLGFSSFIQPSAVYAVEENDHLREWTRIEAAIDPAAYEVQQVWYDSTAGARVSMFLVHRRDLERDGNRPVLLTGYGGFNISRTAEFVRAIHWWLEQGGVYALPNLRGGGEYGEAWHRAGMLAEKQHTFDDFYGAAEWLITQRYTRPERLAILGGSNGGLLVGAALTQRPDLFQAAVCAVPLLDMLRYHDFEIARLWIPEYGSAEDAEQFRWLRAYSPYHHVSEGTCYPATLITTGESDSRVDPMHARKMAARLQAAQGCDRPILLRVEQKAGHGQGKPLTKTIAEQTDVWSFIAWQLGVLAEA